MTRSLIALVTFAAMASPVLAHTTDPVAAPTPAASAPMTPPAPASSPIAPKTDAGKKENKQPKPEPKPQGEAK
ncbi:MAG TPA: hypothetical protein VFY73_09345 [Ideonella sp.]|uniref:hypothetical protein n=1 Tax=Ideonella sp. TaxID=1929293 RepID=UPI002E37B3FC|nr:hypothetical protein [Ideonella sp.]HEX5684229.1 hypothetical protein [Ideonella sp.]